MKWHDQREAFKRLSIQQGISQMEDFKQALPFGYNVPQKYIDRWMDNLKKVPKDFSSQRRYVNRFKLGADPEFIFNDKEGRINAKDYGFQQGLAFGMDNNGRLTEIRPHPSRSAVAVVASILAALRWLAITTPKTLKAEWMAGAFLQGDGLGGHVHFGRKRPGRDAEVKALDAIQDELVAVNAYPLDQVVRRRAGDDRHQLYGMPGDIRKQIHGYEYRTFPSWLDSPELAFLTITLSKLVVLNPGLGQGFVALQCVERHQQRIKNLLSYYKDVDDDARLALLMITREFPKHIGGDFKARWGIGAEPLNGPKVMFIPAAIKPNPEDIQEMFDHLYKRAPLAWQVPHPTWAPLCPPPGYVMSIQQTTTWQAKGLGELLWDVCQHEKNPYLVSNSREVRTLLCIPSKLANQLPTGWDKGLNVSFHGNDRQIFSSEIGRSPENFKKTRKLLLETMLPFWPIDKVKPDSLLQWQAALRKEPKKIYEDKVLVGDIREFPV